MWTARIIYREGREAQQKTAATAGLLGVEFELQIRPGFIDAPGREARDTIDSV